MDFEAFEIVKVLGEGISGRCYLSKNKQTQEQCVIKQIQTQGMEQSQLEKAMRQVRILQSLKHSNIIKFLGSFNTESALHIVMSYAEGGDLSARIKEAKTSFPQTQILQWFTQLCIALKHVHQSKIIHRDIKTQNIFLDSEQNVLLGDFGIAKSLNLTLQKIKSVVGTPFYISPQICENKPYSYKTDIWSLGVVLYQLCTLRHPFDAQSLAGIVVKICRGYYRPIPIQYSENLRKLVTSLLQINPEKRPSISQILNNSFIRQSLERIKARQPQLKSNKQRMREKVLQIFQLMNPNQSCLCSPKMAYYPGGSPLKTPEYKKFPVFNQFQARQKTKTTQKSNKKKQSKRHEKSESCLTPKMKKPDQEKRSRHHHSLWQNGKRKNEAASTKNLGKNERKSKKQLIHGLNNIKQEQEPNTQRLDLIEQMKNAIPLRSERVKLNQTIEQTPLETLEALIIYKIGEDKFKAYSDLVESNLGFCDEIGEERYLLGLWYSLKRS